jgi:hypothetical protein
MDSPETPPSITIAASRVGHDELRRLVNAWFGDMVKLVVDVRRGVVAAGGELHADAEALLLDQGSRQEDLWGANYFPGLGSERSVEFTALINIRPGQGNPSMEIQSQEVRDQVRRLVHALIGEGEAL